jgi:hypothetical protein
MFSFGALHHAEWLWVIARLIGLTFDDLLTNMQVGVLITTHQ